MRSVPSRGPPCARRHERRVLGPALRDLPRGDDAAARAPHVRLSRACTRAAPTDRVRIPFGTSTLTLVTAPTGPLAGDLPARGRGSSARSAPCSASARRSSRAAGPSAPRSGARRRPDRRAPRAARRALPRAAHDRAHAPALAAPCEHCPTSRASRSPSATSPATRGSRSAATGTASSPIDGGQFGFVVGDVAGQGRPRGRR